MNTMFTTVFYASLIPIASLISLLGLIVSYWVEKWQICTRYSKPRELNKHMSLGMIDMLEVMILIYACSILLFELFVGEPVHNVATFGLVGLASINFLLPSERINKKIFRHKEQDLDTEKW